MSWMRIFFWNRDGTSGKYGAGQVRSGQIGSGQLVGKYSRFGGEMMDMERIDIMGHSFGGATAFDASYTDVWIKAGIDMDGTVCSSTMKFTQSKY